MACNSNLDRIFVLLSVFHQCFHEILSFPIVLLVFIFKIRFLTLEEVLVLIDKFGFDFLYLHLRYWLVLIPLVFSKLFM